MTEIKKHQKIKRKIIKIDEDLCTGCGQCVIACAEGALAIIDGKARVISEVFCDGLGACIGECPEGALIIEEREAFEFDEEEVEKHLEGQKETLKETNHFHSHQCSCPSSQPIVYTKEWIEIENSNEIPSALRQWPTKLTLVSPNAPYFNTDELILASDCSPFVYGDFHRKILRGKALATICPMLGLGDMELKKLEEILKINPIKKLTLILMEVSCCQKLNLFLGPIISKIDRKIEIEELIISREGKIIKQAIIDPIF